MTISRSVLAVWAGVAFGVAGFMAYWETDEPFVPLIGVLAAIIIPSIPRIIACTFFPRLYKRWPQELIVIGLVMLGSLSTLVIVFLGLHIVWGI